MNSNDFELFNVHSEKIKEWEYFSYIIKLSSGQTTKQETLFGVTVAGKAYVYTDGKLSEQTDLYWLLKELNNVSVSRPYKKILEPPTDLTNNNGN